MGSHYWRWPIFRHARNSLANARCRQSSTSARFMLPLRSQMIIPDDTGNPIHDRGPLLRPRIPTDRDPAKGGREEVLWNQYGPSFREPRSLCRAIEGGKLLAKSRVFRGMAEVVQNQRGRRFQDEQLSIVRVLITG